MNTTGKGMGKWNKVSAWRLKRWAGIGLWLALVVFLFGLGMVLDSRPRPPRLPSPRECTSHSIKVSDSLILSIPADYSRNEWLRCGSSPSVIQEKRDIVSKSTGWEGLDSFDFFLPDFGGYTIERWRDWDWNDGAVVEVVAVVAAKEWGFNPSDPAEAEVDQFKAGLPVLTDIHKYRDMYGLRCYEGHILKNRMFCYSGHVGENHDAILLTVDVPPYERGIVNPAMQAEYFSKRYGGLHITWSTSVKNLSRWHDIDDQIWKYLTEWNVAGKQVAAD